MHAPNPVAWTLGAVLLMASVVLAAFAPGGTALPVAAALVGIGVLAGTFLVANRKAASASSGTLLIERVVSPRLMDTKPVGTSRMDRALLLAIGRPHALLDLRSSSTPTRRDPLFLPKAPSLDAQVDAVVDAHAEAHFEATRRARPSRSRPSRRGRRNPVERRVRTR